MILIEKKLIKIVNIEYGVGLNLTRCTPYLFDDKQRFKYTVAKTTYARTEWNYQNKYVKTLNFHFSVDNGCTPCRTINTNNIHSGSHKSIRNRQLRPGRGTELISIFIQAAFIFLLSQQFQFCLQPKARLSFK